jgi:ComF family protein
MVTKIAGTLAALEKALHRLLPGYCAFCLGAPEPGLSWCLPCYRELAWNLHGCRLCGEPLCRAQALCRHCRESSPDFDAAYVPLVYQGVIRQLVQDFKFQASPRAGVLLSELFISVLDDCQAQALLPVPLHPTRAHERGFNQSQWLAEQLGARLGVAVMKATRKTDTPSQRSLSRRARFANLAGAFVLPQALPARIAIIDDVVTTGATANALALAARKAGAREITIYALARTSLASP